MNVGKKLMSDSKFYMGYSRWLEDKNRYETWEESVDRVMNMHREKYSDIMTPEIEEYIKFAEEKYKNKKVVGSQRNLQFGGDQIFSHELKSYNCFRKDTKFITSSGVKSFEDFKDGYITSVITHTGKWRNAVVRNYGEQQLQKISFVKGSSAEHVVYATKDHRWILKDGTETTNLKIGDKLFKPVNTFSEFDHDSATPEERLYWCYGMVYGMVYGTGAYLKEAPDPDIEPPELIRAFVSGYLQAYDVKNNNRSDTQYKTIQSSDIDHIEFIRKCFPIAGVWIISEEDLTGQKTKFGVRPYTIMFKIADSTESIHNSEWTVKEIAPSTYEDVWCLEVEEDHSFVMPDGIVTGNCAFTYIDRPVVFQETMYSLLCGVGVGFSVQKHHIAKIPNLKRRNLKKSKVHVVDDSIEGWADAFGVLISSFMESDAPFPKYQGCHVAFDFSEIRPKGSYISGGFKAPGPDGIRNSLNKCEELLEKEVHKSNDSVSIRPIVAYDYIMHMADAVLSGGIRRAATLCLFSKDDVEMMNAKTGNWFVDNPQRGRSNNSALLVRKDVTREEFHALMQSTKSYGEPGFIFAEDTEQGFNPCVEVGLRAYTEDGRSGFNLCNLSSINGALVESVDDFVESCKAASILGTLQAGYTNFKYLDSSTKDITEREALIGVSVTGWMNNPDILFEESTMLKGSDMVKSVNKDLSKLLGINQAARTCTTKPEGNTSVLLGSASGIHGEHSPRYFRNVQINEQDEVLHLIKNVNPKMVEKSVWSNTGTDYVISFPIVSDEGSIYKSDLLGVKQLEYVKKVQQTWVENGTNEHLCVDPNTRHNVSNTITVDDWDMVEDYIYNNRQYFAGISLLSAFGDKAYPQAPFTEVLTGEEIFEKYGDAALFASGLIVDGLAAFNDNLWSACDTVNGFGEDLDDEDSKDLLKRDWVRRAKKFAKNYFNNDVMEMTNCLKDCHNFHKWKAINRSIKEIDFAVELEKKRFIDADTIAGAACHGGQCEIEF